MLILKIDGDRFEICDEITEEVVAIFLRREDALEYLNWKTNHATTF